MMKSSFSSSSSSSSMQSTTKSSSTMLGGGGIPGRGQGVLDMMGPGLDIEELSNAGKHGSKDSVPSGARMSPNCNMKFT